MRAKFFYGFKSLFWKQSTAIEVFKFSCYILVPIAASSIYANPETMKSLILSLNYVSYPKAETSMPNDQELAEIYAKNKQLILNAEKKKDS